MTATTAGAATAVAAGAGGGRSTPGSVRGGVVFWVGLGAALIALALVAGRPPKDGEPLSPDGTGPAGAKGLVRLIEELGADVRTTNDVPGDDVDVVLLLSDQTTDAQQDELARWVGDGGTLVVADPASTFTPVPSGTVDPLGGLVQASTPPGVCTVDALADAGRIDARGGLAFETEGSAGHCYGDEEAAFVVTTSVGGGTIVGVGGAGLFTNEALGELDNAVLAAAFLAPQPGTTVAFLQPPTPGSGDKGLSDLVAPGIKAALLQLVVAFVVYALWRGRRLGPPIEEPQPVQIAGSELVGAVGELLQQSRDPQRAGDLLRDDLRRSLCTHLGLGADSSPEVVARVTAQRTGVDAEAVYAAIAGPPLTSDHDLVSLAQTHETIRKELLHGSGT